MSLKAFPPSIWSSSEPDWGTKLNQNSSEQKNGEKNELVLTWVLAKRASPASSSRATWCCSERLLKESPRNRPQLKFSTNLLRFTWQVASHWGHYPMASVAELCRFMSETAARIWVGAKRLGSRQRRIWKHRTQIHRKWGFASSAAVGTACCLSTLAIVPPEVYGKRKQAR